MTPLPETVLQFGTGKFLRAFADLFIHQANASGQAVGRIVVVQSTGDDRAKTINRQQGRYHVLVRGSLEGQIVDRAEEAAGISRALAASADWPAVAAVARAPLLRYLISNTAEVGYTLDPSDRPTGAPPRSYPAKLLLLLKARFEAGLPGLTLLPCELFERNADRLLALVCRLAEGWQMHGDLLHWIRTECTWRNALVDRIVALPRPDEARFTEDVLRTVTEPYALWAIEKKDARDDLFQHPAIVDTPDVQPYFLRKVRILNAAHTALLSKALPRGFKTVREAVLDPEISAWLDRLLFEEIVPVLQGRVEAPEAFARQTLERFRNPFIEHKLSDIAAYHAEKVKIRLVPTRDEYATQFGRTPSLLEEAVATPAA